MRWALVNSRAARPRSRGGSVSRTTGMIPASHASRRAWPAVIREPSSSSAVACSASSCSRVIVTTTVAFTPAVCGVASTG